MAAKTTEEGNKQDKGKTLHGDGEDSVLYNKRKRDCHQHERTPSCLGDKANSTELDHSSKDLVNPCESIILIYVSD